MTQLVEKHGWLCNDNDKEIMDRNIEYLLEYGSRPNSTGYYKSQHDLLFPQDFHSEALIITVSRMIGGQDKFSYFQ